MSRSGYEVYAAILVGTDETLLCEDWDEISIQLIGKPHKVREAGIECVEEIQRLVG